MGEKERREEGLTKTNRADLLDKAFHSHMHTDTVDSVLTLGELIDSVGWSTTAARITGQRTFRSCLQVHTGMNAISEYEHKYGTLTKPAKLCQRRCTQGFCINDASVLFQQTKSASESFRCLRQLAATDESTKVQKLFLFGSYNSPTV